jgi:hypothetical protein
MRTVEASRFVRAHPREIERLLTPETVLDYEGTFTAVDVEEGDGETVVEARAGGRLMAARFVFDDREDGLGYRQDGEAGPFDAMETEVTYAREDEGVRVTMRSAVSLSLPLPFADRIAAWKRRGELRRALSRLADDVE